MSAFEHVKKQSITQEELFKMFLESVNVPAFVKKTHFGFETRSYAHKYKYYSRNNMVVEIRSVGMHLDGGKYIPDTKVIQHKLTIAGKQIFCKSEDRDTNTLIKWNENSFYELITKDAPPKLKLTKENFIKKSDVTAYRDNQTKKINPPSLFDAIG